MPILWCNVHGSMIISDVESQDCGPDFMLLTLNFLNSDLVPVTLVVLQPHFCISDESTMASIL